MKETTQKTIRVFGDYELKNPLDCDSDILGTEFHIHLGNIVGKILFPKLSPLFINSQKRGSLDADDVIHGPVCPITPTWGNKEDHFGCTEWGQTMSFPKGNSLIKKVMLDFHIQESDIETSVQTIYNFIDSWFMRFYDIYEVVSMTPIKAKKPDLPPLVKGYGFRSAGTLLYTMDPQTNKFLPLRNMNDTGACISIEILDGRLKYDELLKIINLTNEQKDLIFNYRYFLEGFRAFHQEDYKKTITVCSPALEAALLTGIKTFAINNNIYFLDKLLKKYRMLGGYFELANDINLTLPTQDYKTALLDLRNNVVHNGYSPTKEEADKFMKDVRLYLDTFSPNIL